MRCVRASRDEKVLRYVVLDETAYDTGGVTGRGDATTPRRPGAARPTLLRAHRAGQTGHAVTAQRERHTPPTAYTRTFTPHAPTPPTQPAPQGGPFSGSTIAPHTFARAHVARARARGCRFT